MERKICTEQVVHFVSYHTQKVFLGIMKIYSVIITRAFYLTVCFQFWSVCSLYAQNNFSVRTYQSNDGLPSHAVLAHIMQSNKGYLYVISNDGIIRFDGLTFELLNSLDSLPATQTLNTLFQDSKNRLWYGSQGGGFGLLSKPDTLRFLQPGYVKTILEFPDNTLWIGADGNGLWKLNLDADSLKPKAVLPDTSGRTINDLAGGDRHQIFVATNQGLYLIDNQIMSVSKVTGGNVLAVNTGPLLPENTVLYSTSEGLFSKKLAGNKTVKIQHPQLTWPPIDIITHPDGGYLIVTLHALYFFKNNKITQFYAREDAVFSSATIDHEKNIWIGTETDGLIQLIPTSIGKFTTENGLPSNVATVLLQSDEGKIYIGTTSGLAVTTTDFQHPKILFEDSFITSLYQDQNHRIWAGLRNKGVRLLGSNSYKTYSTSRGLPSKYIWTMTEDRKGRLLAGTLKGVAVFDPESDRWNSLFTAENGMLQHNDVRTILPDGTDSYWVGTSFGLHHITGDSVTIYDTKSGLKNAVILDLMKENGRLWIGTSGGGLYRYFKGHFRQIPTGWTGTKIWRLLNSGGHLWFTSETGIQVVHLDSLNHWLDGNTDKPEVLHFDQKEGLPGELVGALQPSGWELDNGRFLFPTFNGVAVLSATVKNKPPPAPPLIINNLIAGTDTLEADTTIRLSHFRGHIDINYTAFSFKNPDHITYTYKLKGFDEDWNHVGSRRTAIYTNLPPGSYQFKVKARIGDTGSYSKPASLPLTIQPLFYETWWFRGLSILIVGFLVWGLVQYRKLQRHKLQHMRVQIARDLHDEIGSNLGSILLRSRMLSKNENLDKKQQTTLAEIDRISRKTAIAMRDIIWLIHPEKDKVKDLNIKLRHITKQFLGELSFDYDYNSKTPKKRSIPLEKRRNIIAIYKEMLHNIVKHAQAHNVSITINTDDKHFYLEVVDDGCGFDPQQVNTAGLGLKNMRKRAEEIDGSLQIHSIPDDGTCCTLEVPIP